MNLGEKEREGSRQKFWSSGDRDRVEVVPSRREKTVVAIVGQRSDRDSTPPEDMGTLDGMGFIGPKEGLDDDMHFSMRKLFVENNVSPMSNDSPPRSLGSIFSNLPLVLYHNLDHHLSKLIKVINVHNVHATYKASASSNKNSNSITGLQGSSKPASHGFILFSQIQSSMVRSYT